MFSCAGIVLAGGLNSRMGGSNKAFLEIDGRPFLDRILATLSGCFDECLLVTREPADFSHLDAAVVSDIFDLRSPLTGIHAGLLNMAADYAFCTSCDTPFLSRETIDILVGEISPEIDAVVPASGSHYQPLCAIYSKKCLPPIEDQLARRDAKVDRLFEKIRLKTVGYDRFKTADPALKAFFNVNTPADLQTAKAMLKNG